MVVYFAPWCGNWRFEAPVAAKLYEKYKAQGFEVIGVSEYASREDVKAFFGPTARLTPWSLNQRRAKTSRRPPIMATGN